MPIIALDHLDSHPDNANRMTPALLEKLTAHVRQSGEYPPLIVRPHPASADRYQILDGHHRAEVLKRLGYEQARCEVWHVDDARASLLLLTLNRLHGEDDPHQRGALLEKLSRSMGLEQLARLVPEDTVRIGRLMALNHDPPPLAEPPPLERMPQAVTFFLTQVQRSRLFEHLELICRDRSEALIRLLALDEP